jgi:tRNA modification GTPase
VSTSSTIAAIATPPGLGALSIVRLSGPESRTVARRLLPSRARRLLEAGRIRFFSSFHDPITGERIDEGLVHVFVAPESFTGEDGVELHGHGGRIAPERLLAATLAAGAVVAGPGAFARRALLNGKLDLLQAEAILDVIEARSEGLHRQAVYQLAGALSRRIEELRRTLLETLAILELQIDFPEEEAADAAQDVSARVRSVREQVATLLGSYAAGGVLRHGVRVVIAGRPNVGKSSLFNCLLGEERAIVTRHPGTTRDAIEAEMSVDGILLRLVDTAGIREARDEVEAIGVELARRQLEAAQVVLIVLDGTVTVAPEEERLLEDARARPHVIAVTKSDVAEGDVYDYCCSYMSKSVNGDQSSEALARPIQTSAVTGQGREELLRTLLRAATEGVRFDARTPALTRLRHKQLLESSLPPLDRALEELGSVRAAPEKVAADVKDAADAVAGLLGAVTSEDVLEEIFSSFCIGK